MLEKKRTLFQRGSIEVWLCSLEGEISVYDRSGELANSQLIRNFPKQIDM